MKSKGWRLAQSYQWVIDQRPPVELTQAVYRQLQENEQKIFGLIKNNTGILPVFTSSTVPSFSFGLPKPNDPVLLPAFNNPSAPSIFARPLLDIASHEFTFGAVQTHQNPSRVRFGEKPA
ncbi:hypothetical protein TEA_009329 [Camellia sinensis var. sinensis]|uniref:Uncharacterized protein n=1 Tax=Camellia sinensis var. sinensis TaxID=542762 RepID=A0A4S4CXW7_CAMSN|nr:hypothetical protein TEA_009329 [Camellia sinensis var. sinensis]